MRKIFIFFTLAVIVFSCSEVLWSQSFGYSTWHFPTVVISGLLVGMLGHEIWRKLK